MQDHIIDENRPAQEFTVRDVPSYRDSRSTPEAAKAASGTAGRKLRTPCQAINS